MRPLLAAFAVSLAVNGAFFALASSRRSDAVTDLSYSLSFALVVALQAWAGGAGDPLRLAAACMVVLWALRLGSYLFARILRMKVDRRFDGIRERPLKFGAFWLFQALAVPVILLPVLRVLSAPTPPPSPLHAAGAALWLAGLLLEAVADAQKAAWKRRGGQGPLTRGLWAWSRHPNYFGEILLWWGLWIFALPSLAGGWHLVVLGPCFLTLLIRFGTGIPPLEQAAELRARGDADLRDYRTRTSLLVPWPPRRTG
ncbi:MAG: DUF1295 domain-containing protein [Acidobacteria bacterium]|nr:DUF1295 domain-containing protein [Acidobacteriota bacterium]